MERCQKAGGEQTSLLSQKKKRKEDKGNYGLVGLTSVPGKARKLILETIARHRKDKKSMGSRQHGFLVGKSLLTDPIAFYNKITGLADEGRAGG